MYVQYSFVRPRQDPYPIEREPLHLSSMAVVAIGVGAMMLISLAYLLG